MTEREAARQRDLAAFQQCIGHQFSRPELLDVALTHASYAHENGLPSWNERLEFLGDAVLELLISEQLFNGRPDASEGQMTRERSSIVREETLSAWGRSLGVPQLLRTGKGQRDSVTENMIGDAVEAILGALYADGGLETARAFLGSRPAGRQLLDAKSRLQILCQQHGELPRYQLISRTGPEHAPLFTVQALLGTRSLAEGQGPSRKAAEQAAAAAALTVLEDGGEEGSQSPKTE